MGFLSKLLGIGQEEITVTRLGQARNYIAENGTSGLTRHYHARAIVDSLSMHTGVSVSEDEAVTLVEEYRKTRGWGKRSHDSYFPGED